MALALGQIGIAIAMIIGAMMGGSDAAGNGMAAGFCAGGRYRRAVVRRSSVDHGDNQNGAETAFILSLIFPAGWLFMVAG